MADDRAIRAALREQMTWSAQSLSNRVSTLVSQQLMPRSHALYVIAHRNGLKLERFGVDDAMLIEVGKLATQPMSTSGVAPVPNGKTQSAQLVRATSPTPGSLFASRDFHPSVRRASRKAFTSGLNQEAVGKAVQSVINRVKRLACTSRDGTALMGWAFGRPPQLQMSDLSTESTMNEHDGLRFLMQGAALGIRNPRAHEDHWEPDDDISSVLELLGFLSFLHRCLDRSEAYRASN